MIAVHIWLVFIAKVVDGKSTHGCGGRWNSHWVNALISILMFYIGPHAICEADGTCLCPYLGMDH